MGVEEYWRRLWARRLAQAWQQTNDEDPRVDIYRYAPTWRFWAPASRLHVYITKGMADRDMPVAEVGIVEPGRVQRVELSAFTTSVREAEPGRDAVAWLLTTLAHLPWREGLSFMPLETVMWGGPLLEGSAMAAVFFGLPPIDDSEGLARAMGADVVLNVMTITTAERELAVREGSAALVDRFEAAGVPPLLDWDRPSCVGDTR